MGREFSQVREAYLVKRRSLARYEIQTTRYEDAVLPS